MNDDETYVRRALELAAAAADEGDVPIGAVLVSGDLVLEAKNEKEARRDPTAHAEMLLLQEAARRLGAWRLSDATLYVTKEPCVMCAGAMIAARIKRLVYGASRPERRRGRRRIRSPALGAHEPSLGGHRRSAAKRGSRTVAALLPAETRGRRGRSRVGRFRVPTVGLGEVVEWLKAPASKAGER